MEGIGMGFAVSPLRAWHPWTCWSNKNQANSIFWQSACDAEVSAHISKRWGPTKCIEFLWILPHREGVEPNPFIAVPKKVAPITSVGEEQCLSSMAGEVTMVPPGEERATLSLRVNYRGLFLHWVFLSEITSAIFSTLVALRPNSEPRHQEKEIAGWGWRGKEGFALSQSVMGWIVSWTLLCWSAEP